MKELSKELYKLSKSPIRNLVKRSFAAARVQYDHDSKLYANAKDWECHVESEITALENQLAMRKDEIFEKVRGKATEQQICDAMEWIARGILKRLRAKQKFDLESLCDQYLAEHSPKNEISEKLTQPLKEVECRGAREVEEALKDIPCYPTQSTREQIEQAEGKATECDSQDCPYKRAFKVEIGGK